MRKGFALLETIIVITFLSVSLLLLYGTFSNMVKNSQRNILYDDAGNIYKAFYVKEYLKEYNLASHLSNDKIKMISCDNFPNSGCQKLIEAFKINKMYITKVDLKSYDEEKYTSNLNNYLKSLSNKDENEYRLIIEINNEETYSYASISINGGLDE